MIKINALCISMDDKDNGKTWLSAKVRIEEAGFSAFHFPGVDGKKLTDVQLQKLLTIPAYSKLIHTNQRSSAEELPSLGAVGCYLAHVHACDCAHDYLTNVDSYSDSDSNDTDIVYKNGDKLDIINHDNKKKMIMIVESDVIFTLSKSAIEKAISQLQNLDFDLALLDYFNRRQVSTEPSDQAEWHFLKPGSQYMGNHCYILSERGARKLAAINHSEENKKIECQIDTFYSHCIAAKGLVVVGCNTQLASQTLHLSSVQGKRLRTFGVPSDLLPNDPISVNFNRIRMQLSNWCQLDQYKKKYGGGFNPTGKRKTSTQ